MPHTQRTHIKRITALIAVVLVLILLLLYMQGTFVSKVSPGLSPQVNQPDPSMHNTTTVIKKLIDNKMAWPGTVKSKTVASIAPKMTARIIDIKVNAGDAVKRGDLIARLDERDIKAQEQIALAALAEATAEASRAQADEGRIRSLYSKEAATRENFDAVIARAKAAQARVNQATSTVREVRTHLADTLLLAPFDGIVVKRLQQPGDMGLPGVPIVSMQLAKGLRLEVDVPSSCADSYHIGMDVTVHIDTLNQKIAGQINEISPEIDSQTHTQLIKISLPAIVGLKPGYFGWLEQACDQHEALLIPASAIQHIGQLEVVQIWSEGRMQMRHIRTAKTFGDQIELISGLRACETIITHPQQQTQ